MADEAKTSTDRLNGRYPAPAVAAAARIISYLAAVDGGAGVSQIARDLALNKSTCFNVLATLTAFEVVTKHPRYAIYRLGPRLVEWGTATRSSFALKTVIHRDVRQFVAASQLTCLIGQVLAENRGIVVMDRVVPRREGAATASIGQVFPLSSPAMGRVVLSSMSDADAVEAAHQAGILAVGDESRFLEQLRDIRAHGYATSKGEYTHDLNAVAAAVLRGPADVAMVLCVIGYPNDLPVNSLDEHGRQLVALARQLDPDLVWGGVE